MRNIEIKCNGTYLSENIDRFDFANENEINFINKGTCGCGGTTLAIETALKENSKLILLMPTVSAVMSKSAQFPEAKALYGDKKIEAIHLLFDKSHNYNIILATYDKFNSIKEAIDTNDYYLVIDEYHTLTRDAGYRDCMIKLLQGWDNFKSVTLLTATPDEFLVEAIKNTYTNEITETNYVWNNKRVAYLHNVEGKLHTYLVNLVKNWDSTEHNLYLMLNNVKEINNIIADSGITNYHIQCSESRKNEVEISSIDDINAELRPINFLTASGFEGCDIKDPTGVIYTIVDMSVNSTIFDWQTLVQMQGRCRGSKEYPHIVYHYSKLREDQLLDLKNKTKALKLAKIELGEKTVKEVLKDDDYLVLNNKIIVNPFKESEIARLKDTLEECQTYKSFFNYLRERGYIINTVSDKIEAKKNKHLGFKAICKLYEEGKDIKGYNKTTLVKRAYEKLGKDKVKEVNYSERLIEGLLKMMDNDFTKPSDLLNIKVGRFYTTKSLIKAISDINKIAATIQHKEENSIETFLPMLDNWCISTDDRILSQTLLSLGYITLSVKKTVNGKQVWGYEILSDKNSKIIDIPTYTNGVSTNMNFSMSTKAGVKISRPKFNKVYTLGDIVKPRPTVKAEQWYMSDCYNDLEDTYERKETSFNSADCMIIDIDDNGWTIESLNKYIEEYYGNCLHYVYKTFSYTEEKQKFRVIFPLSETIKFRDDMNDTRNFKAAKIQMFPEIHDTNCQLWFFAPNETPEIYGNSNILLNSEYIRATMTMIGIHKEEITDLIEIKVNEPKKESDIVITDNSANVLIAMINNATDGEWNNKIWAAVYYMKKEDINTVRDGIIEPLKRDYFEEKLRYKRN